MNSRRGRKVQQRSKRGDAEGEALRVLLMKQERSRSPIKPGGKTETNVFDREGIKKNTLRMGKYGIKKRGRLKRTTPARRTHPGTGHDPDPWNKQFGSRGKKFWLRRRAEIISRDAERRRTEKK